MQHGTGGDDGVGHALYAETFQRCGAELAREAFEGGVVAEHPLLEVKHQVFLRQVRGHGVAVPFAHQQFLGCHAGHHLVYIIGTPFGGEEFAGRDIEEGHAGVCLAGVDCGQIVVLLVREDIVVHGDTGCHQFDDSALHQGFGLLGVLELLADCHALAGADQFRQVCVEGVVGESGQFHMLCGTVGAACQGDAEDFRRGNGIVGESFIEVAHTKQQNSVGMFFLHLEVLLHERSFDNFLGHITTKLRKNRETLSRKMKTSMLKAKNCPKIDINP